MPLVPVGPRPVAEVFNQPVTLEKDTIELPNSPFLGFGFPDQYCLLRHN